MSALLEIDRLSVHASGPTGPVSVVREVSLRLDAGEAVGLVGKSGVGKTLSAYAVTGLLPSGVEVSGGRVLFDGTDLLGLDEAELRRIRGRRIAMVFQDAAAALNPVFTIGFQMREAIRTHRRMSRSEAEREAVRLLRRVALPEPEHRMRAYPHQLSGGQNQRIVLAMALACGPDLLLADEPTTALDVTTQAQILHLLEDLRRELGLAVLLITHDLAVVAETCDRVVVLHDGRVVEEASVDRLFERPSHWHTRELLDAAAAGRGRGAA